ncbi:hypothetical protein Pmani_023917 [Petrolisthes manimaculis]|uniref:ubiquitinyl hydrolase 1 n=1 Tax=Petrolisthes manimaculis TaxID=1843537 RepID=A0AAE1PB37_9EUCA|nr:hypothetical protein Pmani_023917 [Petrolisthes manimaculis]
MGPLYREEFDPGPSLQQMNPPYRQDQDNFLPQQMAPSYREEYYPPPQQMDPSNREDYGPPPPQMELPYRNEYGSLPHHMNPFHDQEYGPPPEEMVPSYRDKYDPPPLQTDPHYRQEQGPLPVQTDPQYREEQGPIPLQTDPHYRQDQGPLPVQIDPHYRQEQGPFPVQIDPHYRQEQGPIPVQIDPHYRQEQGPIPVQIDPHYRQEQGPIPVQIDPHYRQEQGPIPVQIDPHYRQEQGPIPVQIDPHYRQEQGPIPVQIDAHYRQEQGPPQLEMDPPFERQQMDRYRQANGPPSPQQMASQYRQQDQSFPLPDEVVIPFQNEVNPSPQKGLHYQYPNGPDNVMENGLGDRGAENTSNHLSPKTLVDALKEADINLPRLAVLPSNAPAKPKWGECGLPNLGQTSYLNTVMQCLSHTPQLVRYFVSREFLEDVVKKESAKGGQVVKAVADLITEMDRGQAKMGTMAFLKGVCGKMNEKYAGTGQRDSYDLLISLLQWLHKGLASGEPECACTKNSSKKRTPKDKSTVPANNVGMTPSSGHHQQPNTSSGNNFSPQSNPAFPPSNNQSYSNSFPQQLRKMSNNSDQQQQYHQYPPAPFTSQHPPIAFNTATSPQHIPPGHKMSSSSSNSVSKKCKKCGLRVEPSSLISDTFEGIHRSNIICPVSGVIICSIHDRFMSLSLSLNYPGDAPLEEALEHYYRIQAIDWDCPYCGYQHLCHQQMHILFLPKVLILHLDRYNEDGHDPKLTRVTFPTNEFILGDFMTPGWKGRSKEYSLYGISNLHGRGNSSHYTTCCQSNKYNTNNKRPWIIFDDDMVQLIERFKNPREAHILFYRIEEEDI